MSEEKPVVPGQQIPAGAGQLKPPEQKAPISGQEKPLITYDEFAKLDLRVARVLDVRPHPNADKLLCMTIDLGGQQRQIIAGLRAYCSPESLAGKEIVVLVNLQPRKMRGLESNGMLLAATCTEGGELRDVVVLVPQKEVPPGSPVS